MKVGDLVKHKTFNDKIYSVGYVLLIRKKTEDCEKICLVHWTQGRVLWHEADFIQVLQSVNQGSKNESW